jgi:hypothetical protein
MKRTTVVISDQLAALLDSERRRRNTPVAAIIREAIERYFFDNQKPPSFIGIVDGGGTGLQAKDIDEYLAAHWADDIVRDRGPEESTPAGDLNRQSAD